MPAGRPLRFDDEKKKIFCNLVSIGCSRQTAAKCLGIAPYTVSRHLLDSPAFREQIRAAEIALIQEVLVSLIAAAKKNWRAAAWLLPRLNLFRCNRPPKAAEASTTAIFEDAQWSALDEIPCDDADYASTLAREELRLRLSRGRGPLDHGDPNDSTYRVNSEILRDFQVRDAQRVATEGEPSVATEAASSPTQTTLSPTPTTPSPTPLPEPMSPSGPQADRLTEANEATPFIPSRPNRSPLDPPNYALPSDEKILNFPLNSAPQTSPGST